ncbi:MAG: hypothetical protein ABIH82_03300 [Candidatus Woesearchaeota archaeon]
MKKRIVLAVLLLVVFILFLIGCSNEINEEKIKEEKEALYGDALRELRDDNLTNSDLDKRFNLLQERIENSLDKKKEFNLGEFVGMKIEFDYMKMQGYNSSKVDNLWDGFITSLSKLEDEDYAGSSLNDRYYSINKTIERISTGEENMSVSKYLELDQKIRDLEEDGYIEKRTSDLKAVFFKLVISEVENALLNYEPLAFEEPEPVSEVEEIAERLEETVSEEIVERLEETGEVIVEELSGDEKVEERVTEEEAEIIEEPSGPKTVIVKVIDGGFDVDSITKSITINVGDTVQWLNVRDGHYKMAFIVGNRNCKEARSKFYNAGESYNYTFTEAQTCWISDGIYTTQAMKVIVS